MSTKPKRIKYNKHQRAKLRLMADMFERVSSYLRDRTCIGLCGSLQHAKVAMLNEHRRAVRAKDQHGEYMDDHWYLIILVWKDCLALVNRMLTTSNTYGAYGQAQIHHSWLDGWIRHTQRISLGSVAMRQLRLQWCAQIAADLRRMADQGHS